MSNAHANLAFPGISIPVATPRVVGLIWLLATIILTAHFRFYYGAVWADAAKWGLGDGFGWCLMLVALGHVYRSYVLKMASSYRIISFLGLGIFAAVVLHPAFVTALYLAIDGSISRPFLDDAAFLVLKRLPQGILAGLAMTLAIMGLSKFTIKHQAHRADSRLKLKTGAGVHCLDIGDILYAEASGNYVSICVGDKTYLERSTLKSMARKLEDHSFCRISRKHLVNLEHVRSIIPRNSKGAAAIFQNGIKLPISRQYKPEVMAAFALFSEGGRS